MNMEDESSYEVIVMDSEESQPSLQPTVDENVAASTDRPLMEFFKRLVLNKHSQNTMLTNAQLEDILNKEFKFNLLKLHALEVDIYVTILKKYLKEWPMWDEFETTTKDLTENYEQKAFENILEKRYKSLKVYLKTNLDMAKDLSADLVAKVKKSEKSKSKKLSGAEDSKNSDPSDVVLEIQATRDQLNKLIYRQPHPEFNNTIFSAEDRILPSHIKLNTLSLAAILNWWSVRITISLQVNNVFLVRETTHELQHLLVNRQGKGKRKTPLVNLNQEVQIRETKKVRQVAKKEIIGCLNFLCMELKAKIDGLETIIQVLKKSLESLDVLAAPAQYRCYLNKHPYVRYLYSDSESKRDESNYDIQLKETISPMHQFYIGRLDVLVDKSLPPQWLKVECVTCKLTFSGESLGTELKQHFEECHLWELDWECTNCQKVYPMAQLAERGWRHDCDKTND